MKLNELYSSLELNYLYSDDAIVIFLKIYAAVFTINFISYLLFKKTLTNQIVNFYEQTVLTTIKYWDKKIIESTDAMFKKIQLDEDSTISEGLSLQISKGLDYDDMARIIEEKISILKENENENEKEY